jgi:hypothetical protein
MNNVADWLVTPFFDVVLLIKNRVNANVRRAANLSSSREALNKALTAVAARQAYQEWLEWHRAHVQCLVRELLDAVRG